VPITYRRDGKEYEARVRLAGVHRAGELEALLDTEQEPPVPDKPPGRDKEPKPGDQPKQGEKPAPGDKPKPGDGPKPVRSRVLVHSSGFQMSPYADVKPSGEDVRAVARKLWHRSPGSPG